MGSTRAAATIGTRLPAAGYLVAVGAGPVPISAQASVPTYAKDVAPILLEHCATCHRLGEIGPMSLRTYEDAQPYASLIRDEVRAGHMPPWHADSPPGTFLNASGISKTASGAPIAHPFREDRWGRQIRLGAARRSGTNAMTYRPGLALRIPAGTVLTFQMHYTAHGAPADDRTRVGFVFADEPPAREVFVSQCTNLRCAIPPGAAAHRVDSVGDVRPGHAPPGAAAAHAPAGRTLVLSHRVSRRPFRNTP